MAMIVFAGTFPKLDLYRNLLRGLTSEVIKAYRHLPVSQEELSDSSLILGSVIRRRILPLRGPLIFCRIFAPGTSPLRVASAKRARTSVRERWQRR